MTITNKPKWLSASIDTVEGEVALARTRNPGITPAELDRVRSAEIAGQISELLLRLTHFLPDDRRRHLASAVRAWSRLRHEVEG